MKKDKSYLEWIFIILGGAILNLVGIVGSNQTLSPHESGVLGVLGAGIGMFTYKALNYFQKSNKKHIKSNKRLIALIAASIIILIFFGYMLFPKETPPETEYIFDKTYNISLEDVKKSRKALPRDPAGDAAKPETGLSDGAAPGAADSPAPGLNLREIFAEGLINSYTTLKYFKHLEHQFRKSATLGEHLDEVKKYLFSEFSEAEAQTLFDTYKDYLLCEMDLVEEFRNLTSARSTEEAIEILKQIQEFRRNRLGVELADKLFGADVKAKEYAFRRADIVGDKTLYGEAKEAQLKKLNEDMWGMDAAAVEEHPNDYNRYREKLLIYDKDLTELNSDELRQAKIKEFRTDFFTPEVVERLDAVDRQITADTQKETNHREKEKQILEDTGLTDETKNKKIEALQNELFGEEAEAFRRGETMRIELEKMMQETKKAKKTED